jgi:hypothetical protein
MKAEGTVGAPTCFYMDILLFFASALSVHNLENQPDGGIGRSFRSFSVYDTESVTPYLTKNRARCILPWSYRFGIRCDACNLHAWLCGCMMHIGQLERNWKNINSTGSWRLIYGMSNESIEENTYGLKNDAWGGNLNSAPVGQGIIMKQDAVILIVL